mgnify:CR=1 FL=1
MHRVSGRRLLAKHWTYSYLNPTISRREYPTKIKPHIGSDFIRSRNVPGRRDTGGIHGTVNGYRSAPRLERIQPLRSNGSRGITGTRKFVRDLTRTDSNSGIVITIRITSPRRSRSCRLSVSTTNVPPSFRIRTS